MSDWADELVSDYLVSDEGKADLAQMLREAHTKGFSAGCQAVRDDVQRAITEHSATYYAAGFREGIEAAAKVCDEARPYYETSEFPAIAVGAGLGAISACQLRIRALTPPKPETKEKT